MSDSTESYSEAEASSPIEEARAKPMKREAFNQIAPFLVAVAVTAGIIMVSVGVSKKQPELEPGPSKDIGRPAAPLSSAKVPAAKGPAATAPKDPQVRTTPPKETASRPSKVEPVKSESSSTVKSLFVGGAAPSRRPSDAPSIKDLAKDADWYARALTGLAKPYPRSFKFLEDQGAWYTPFNKRGMTGPYDIRSWHE